MLFNSYIFILLFLPVTLIGYYGLNRINFDKAATGFLVIMSFWFYGYNSIQYLLLLIISLLLNYYIVHYMRRCDKKKKFLMILGVMVNLGILFVFKYFDFFIENISMVFKTDIALLHLKLPLGISFYTFQQLSYVIDSYKDDCEEYNLLDYAAYVTFFPQLIAGPIVYHDELIPQFRKKENRKVNYENMSKGLYAVSMGLAKKVLIADNLVPIVKYVFDSSADFAANVAWIGVISYSLQLYFDFSGYCDMACGIGYMFNIKLPVNFDSPYKATAISDFWKRWHMTLTRFLTKYVYIPLGGNRKGRVKRDLNIMIVFLLSGLWHGANWTFLIWGALHGVLQVIDRYVGTYWQKITKFIKIPVTFATVSVLWSIFRSESLAREREIISYLFNGRFSVMPSAITKSVEDMFEYKLLTRCGIMRLFNGNTDIVIYIWILVLMLAVFFMKNTMDKINRFNFEKRKVLITVLLMTLSILSLSGVSEFLYSNF